MNFKLISDDRIIAHIEKIAHDDRARLVEFLHCLREIEIRRLFSAKRHASVYAFLTEHLKYSSGEALLRIDTMRIMRENPEVEAMLRDGSINMSNLSLARLLFRKEQKAGRTIDRAQVIRSLRNVSTRTARRILSEINPEMKAFKELSYESVEDELLYEKLMVLKGRMAHKDPYLSLIELLHLLCDEALKDDSPRSPKEGSVAEIKRAVKNKYGGKCGNCGSTYALQFDHIVPVAAGGKTTFENLRLLCRNCNLRAAVVFYGRKKMGDHLSDVRGA